MEYPKEFKEKAKRIYPSFEKLHIALDSGSEFAGRYLDDSASSTMTIAEVLSAKSFEELQAKARKQNEGVKLYKEWWELFNAQKEAK